MRVLVTGSLGFAGQHVVGHLLEATNWEVVTLDRRDSIEFLPRLTRVVHDLRQPLDADVEREIGTVDSVINLASISDVPTFLETPVQATLANVTATLHLLEWARRRSLQSFIQVSTNEVYGPAEDGKSHTELARLLPSTPYSGSKAAQEVIATAWWRTYGIPVTIVNTMHLFGPGQPAQRFIPTVVRQILNDQPVTLYGRHHADGTWESATRNWTYVYDFADALRSLVLQEQPCLSEPGRWNVAGPEASCLAVVSHVAELLGRERPPINWCDVGSARPGYELHYALDTRKMRQVRSNPVGFNTGIARTVAHLSRIGVQ